MKLFSKKRSLAVCAASVALAAAVLLTGCGGGSGGGGGSTPTPNPNPVEPVEPEEPDNEWKDVAVPGETVKTENVTMEVEKTNVASNTQVDSEDTRFAYAPFNFKITNTTDKPVDLKETLVQPQSVCNAIALFSAEDGADDVDYKNEFNNGHASEHLTVTLKGKAVDATVQIHVYNGLGVEQPNTTILQEKDWYGTFDVVAKVPADWTQKDEPLKVNYNLPAQTGVAEIKADFAVTRDGDKVKAPATLAFKADSDGTQVQKLNSVYIAVVGGTVTNQSETTVADISDFLNAEEYNALQQVQNEYAADYMKTHENCTVADVQESLVKYIVEIAGENDEKYPFYQYLATSIETRNTAKVLVKFEGKNAKKSLNPGDSAYVTIYIMSTTAENATLRYNNSALLAVDEQEFKNAGSSETPDIPSDFPTITGPLGGGSYEDTLNNQKGYLLYAIVKAENTTGSPYDTWNTLTSLGITGSEHPKAEQVYAKGIPAKNITATGTTQSGQTVTGLPVIVARQTGTDSKLGVDETDNIFVFCFVPTGGDNWKQIDFYYNGIKLGYLVNQKQDTPSESEDIGGGKTYKALGKYQTNLNEKTAVYDGVNMALMGYFKYASDDSYDYIGAVIRLKNDSENVNVPLENSDKSALMINGKPDYAGIATSEDFASQYITIKNGGYAFGVLSTKSSGDDSDKGTLLPQESCTGNINVVIRVPKNWNSNIILKYILPWTNGKYVRFELSAQDILGDVTSSDTSSEGLKLQWYGPNFSNQGEYLCKQVSDTEYMVASNCMVKNQGTSSFVMNNAVLASDFEEVLTRIAQSVAKQNPNATEEELTKLTLQAYVKNMEDTTVMVKVGSTYYKAALLVDQKVVAPGDEAKVYVMALLPAGGGTLQYCYNGKPFTMLIQYPEGAYATATQSMVSNFASLFRAVK